MQRLSSFLLKLLGWKLQGDLPTVNKAIVIFAPHTSNWDFVLMFLVRYARGMDVSFLGKHTIFRWPFGYFLRAMGGIPLVRHASHQAIREVLELFKQRDKLLLALSPEGTRRHLDHWKLGFYTLALKTGVPLVMTYLDKPTKVLGIGPLVHLSGNLEEDFAVFRAFYGDKRGIRPNQASTIQAPQKGSGEIH